MNQYSIIGLVGRAGAGKDTVASILQDAYGHIPVAFADALREEICDAFGIDIDAMVNRYTKEQPSTALAIIRCKDSRFVDRMVALAKDLYLPRSPRQIMRWWGTEFRRDCDSSSYWTDRLHERIESHLRSGARKIVVTDVRFFNEAEFVRIMGGEIWRIQRDSADAIDADHQSESEQDRIEADRSISNNRTLGSLVENVLVNYELDNTQNEIKVQLINEEKPRHYRIVSLDEINKNLKNIAANIDRDSLRNLLRESIKDFFNTTPKIKAAGKDVSGKK